MAPVISDADLRDILQTTKVIGCVGASLDPSRPSYGVVDYMVRHGYKIIGVNPNLAGQDLFGTPIVSSIADLPDDVDMLDVFRRSEAVPPIVAEAIDALPNLRTVWLQLGVMHADAEAKAQAAGLRYVANRCPKIDHARLMA
ncbi:CoA-binding protein [Shimia ponticola]|uniref:CoA-binding protein n=1 Tax=Shimia ponticola TaxID=2582893 RepID=UPI0011BE837D|nr:CoA-binding protein [Shimia ponticola]